VGLGHGLFASGYALGWWPSGFGLAHRVRACTVVYFIPVTSHKTTATRSVKP
jgi:hypothetical protein